MNDIDIYKPPESDIYISHEEPEPEGKESKESYVEPNLKRKFFLSFIGSNIIFSIWALLFLDNNAWGAGIIATITISLIISCLTLFIPDKFEVLLKIIYGFFCIVFMMVLKIIEHGFR